LITSALIDLDFEISALPGAQRSFLKALRSLVNMGGIRKEVLSPLLAGLNEIQAPTLIVWGAQDRILPVAHAHSAEKRFRKARLHVFDSCGHLPNYEQADAFNSLVVDFLTDG
jgi:4,5:9,10-diseco-3-hydroxy-5,9,17-trioxoandrosta-1(10),2-diene-4-oate hydrolase